MLYRVSQSTEKTNKTGQILAVSIIALTAAACSTDVQRFAHVTSEPGASTASIPESSMTKAAPLERVRTEPLTPVARNSYTPSYAADYSAPPPVASKDGARTVVVEHGDTLNELSRRHNVSVGEIAAANNLKWPYNVQVGQRLNIPAPGAPRTAWNKPASGSTSISKNKPGPGPRNPAFAGKRSSPTGEHVVKSGETIYGISRSYGMTPVDLARLNNLDSSSVIKVGQKLRVSGKVAAVKAPAKVLKTTKTASYVPLPRKRPAPASSRIVSKPASSVRKPAYAAKTPVRKPAKPIIAKTPAVSKPAVRVASRSLPSYSAGGAKFRYPVKGRVISDFGRKANGSRNDGINFAVPEGASVKAAGHGVVAYAGNELKGYGNLILIRHSDDWVTAYAHNKQLLVKRGQKVRRGEIIAKAGQTGSVDRPQLHFEVRKGAQAVNPKKYLGRSV